MHVRPTRRLREISNVLVKTEDVNSLDCMSDELLVSLGQEC